MRLITIILAFISLNIAAQESDVVLKIDTAKVYGTLLEPNTYEKPPLVILHAGSGPTDRNGNQTRGDNNSLKYTAEALEKAGIATLRYDKRGIAESKDSLLKESDLVFDDFVDDLRAWIDLMVKKDRFSKIILAGHSEGSLICMLAAIDNPNVAAYISIAGPARCMDEVLLTQLAKQNPMMEKYAAPLLDSLKNGHQVKKPPMLLQSLFRQSVQPYLRSWLQYTPSEEIKKITQPTLIIQGDMDIQVAVSEGEQLKESKADAALVTLENMNHVLKYMDSDNLLDQLPTYTDPEPPLHPQFAKALVKFIERIE